MLEQSDNLNYCFWLCCYFRSILVPRNCSFKSLLYISQKIYINNNWIIGLLHKLFEMLHLLFVLLLHPKQVNQHLDYQALLVLLILQMLYILSIMKDQFLFQANPWQIKRSPKITQTF